MSQSGDYDDFLGWAPDFGSWDAAVEPAARTPPPPPVVTTASPPPQPARRTTTPARSAPPPRPAPTPAPQARPGRPQRSKMVVPLFVAFAAMCVITLMTVLETAFGGPGGSLVPLLVCVGVTSVLGRLAWFIARR